MAVRPRFLRFGPQASPYTRPSVHAAADLPAAAPYRLGGLAARNLAPCVPPSLVTVGRGTGILTRCPSPAARALGLGPPYPQLISMAAEPSGIRWAGFAPASRYSCRHSRSPPLHRPSQAGFTADGDAPLPYALARTSAASAVDLSPVTLSAPAHVRPVSYYALFQGWLLLSQPPGCLGTRTSLPT